MHIQPDYNCARCCAPGNIKKVEQHTCTSNNSSKRRRLFWWLTVGYCHVCHVYFDKVKELIKFKFVPDKVIAPSRWSLKHPLSSALWPPVTQETGINQDDRTFTKISFFKYFSNIFFFQFINLNFDFTYIKMKYIPK